jgi:uncharacterized alkaline shock family protein YloU
LPPTSGRGRGQEAGVAPAKVLPIMREIETHLGRLVISEEAVAAIAGAIALATPGIAGMAPRGLVDILKGDPHAQAGRGVDVAAAGDRVDLGLDVVVAYGTRIHAVAAELEARLRRELPALTGIAVGRVSVRVQGVRRVDG